MNIETIRNICQALPSVTEDIKWGSDLCFMIGGKMFCVISLEIPLKVSLKVPDEEFPEMLNLPGIVPAPYVARYKWILIEDISVLDDKKWRHYIGQSYQLVRAKLSVKVLGSLAEQQREIRD
jgi:predicted DNA-binding protein (MmcQ/YjbR family)